MAHSLPLKNIQEFKVLQERITSETSHDLPVIAVSNATCGRARGSAKIVAALREEIKKRNLKDKVVLKVTGCHGFCEAEPNVVILPKGIFYQKLKPEDVGEIIEETILNGRIVDRLLWIDPTNGEKVAHEKDMSFFGPQQRWVSGNNRLVDPTSIDDYIAIGGYQAFHKVLSGLSSEQVIDQVKKSGLRGRGGAGFSTGRKWEFCHEARGDIKYVVCNADEGDPGAYMDRSLLEGNPHCVLEGMLIGAFAIGAREGWMYVRNEYPLAVENVSIAIDKAREYGFLGDGILGTGFTFDIKVAKGAGAFVCGEETSLMASIEGRKGIPRQRPPFPVQKGLWGKPTNINNVETWANVPLIVSKGADWFAGIGTEKSKGTKIFSLVGKINNTGLVEVPMGITLREIVHDIGGGVPKGKKFKAVQTGGPSGGCIPAKLLDLPVDYERLAEAGSIMGSGGMIVMDEDTCMVDVAKYFMNFLRDESCGKCLSCREGTSRMYDILTDITEGRGTMEQLDLLEELAGVVRDASMCGLGQTAANPVFSTLRYFRDEYIAHIKYKKCPAVVCKGIISSPCQYLCPLGQDVPQYTALIAKGEFKEAIEVIRLTNPLPGVLARVCPRMCETKCRVQEGGRNSIAIRALKRFVSDYEVGEDSGQVTPYSVEYKEKVAIVGSGPAGLTCAYFLRQKGYETTVFEAASVPGGMLSLTIPEYRLPRSVVEYEINRIKACGVEIKTNTPVKSTKALFDQGFKAVFVATGAYESKKLGIVGEDADDVLDPIRLLRDVREGTDVQIGRKVGVVGGGNVAVDAARTALRLGADEVTIIYRRTRKEMPAENEEIDAAEEEGIKIEYLALPTKLIVKNGKIEGAECLRMRLGDADESGRCRPEPIKGSEFVVELDTFVPAITQEPDVSLIKDVPEIEVSKWNTIIVDSETLATPKSGVFAGGDVVSGPLTVTNAMASGKIASESIHSYLRTGKAERSYSVVKPSVDIEPIKMTDEELEKLPEMKRPSMPVLEVSQRSRNFDEVELGLTRDMAINEAKCCLRCDRG
jgi:NADH-quinone oxidoreductase subunit F